MHPMTTFMIGLAVGVSVTAGFQFLVVWCVTKDLDDAGWMRGGDHDRGH